MFSQFAYAANILSTAFFRTIQKRKPRGSDFHPSDLYITWVCSDDANANANNNHPHFVHYICWFRGHQYYLTINTRNPIPAIPN